MPEHISHQGHKITCIRVRRANCKNAGEILIEMSCSAGSSSVMWLPSNRQKDPTVINHDLESY